MKFLIPLLLSALVILPAQAQKKKKEPKGVPTSFDGAVTEVYKTVGDLALRLHIFNPAGHKASDSRPAVVFFFGGGWSGGTPSQFEPHARYLASRGMVAAVANYRVSSRNKTTPFECVKDGKSAVRYLRANAKRLGIDPKRIAAGGGSAGGHVAAATGTVPGLDDEAGSSDVSAKPDALLLFNPVYDNGPKGYGHARVKDRYKEISPMHNIGKGHPPTIMFLGSKDSLIPVSTADTYKKKVEAAGGRCDNHIYEGRAHGFFNQGKGGSKDYVDTVEKMDGFLVSLGWLKGEPTIKTQD